MRQHAFCEAKLNIEILISCWLLLTTINILSKSTNKAIMSRGFACAGCCDICSLILLVMISIATCGVSLASFIIAADHWNVMCDDTSFMPLPTWVVTIAAISLVCCIVAFIVYAVKRLKKDYEPGFNVLVGLTVIASIIVVIFNGMGCRILFHHSSSCYTAAYPLWAISLTALIFQWIIMTIGLMLLIVFVVVMYKECPVYRT